MVCGMRLLRGFQRSRRLTSSSFPQQMLRPFPERELETERTTEGEREGEREREGGREGERERERREGEGEGREGGREREVCTSLALVSNEQPDTSTSVRHANNKLWPKFT